MTIFYAKSRWIIWKRCLNRRVATLPTMTTAIVRALHRPICGESKLKRKKKKQNVRLIRYSRSSGIPLINCSNTTMAMVMCRHRRRQKRKRPKRNVDVRKPVVIVSYEWAMHCMLFHLKYPNVFWFLLWFSVIAERICGFGPVNVSALREKCYVRWTPAMPSITFERISMSSHALQGESQSLHRQ